MDTSNARCLVKMFDIGEMEITDKTKSGQPTSVADANLEWVEEFIRGDRCVTLQNVADALKDLYGSARGLVAMP